MRSKTDIEGPIIAFVAAYELTALSSRSRIPTVSNLIKRLPLKGRLVVWSYLAYWFWRHIELWWRHGLDNVDT